jgi:hypothetical protein
MYLLVFIINKKLVSKFLRIKYPLMAAIMVTVAYDYGYYMYADVPQGH